MNRIKSAAQLIFLTAALVLPKSSFGGCKVCELQDPGGESEKSYCADTLSGGAALCLDGDGNCHVLDNDCIGPVLPGAGGCFLAGSLVATPAGNVRIESLKKGDPVYSEGADGSKKPSVVTRTYVVEAFSYLVINGNLRVTSTHPFYVNGSWVQAGDIRTGQSLLNKSGARVQVVTIEQVNRGVRVYNIEVEGTHTFFVNGVLVHNKIGMHG